MWYAAQHIDAAVEAIERVSGMWLGGCSFTYEHKLQNETAMLFGKDFPYKREEDTVEEIDACADYLHGQLQGAIVKYWAKNLSRDDAVVLGRIMEQQMLPESEAQYKVYKNEYTIVAGASIDGSQDLMRAWNGTHPDEKPIEASELWSKH